MNDNGNAGALSSGVRREHRGAENRVGGTNCRGYRSSRKDRGQVRSWREGQWHWRGTKERKKRVKRIIAGVGETPGADREVGGQSPREGKRGGEGGGGSAGGPRGRRDENRKQAPETGQRRRKGAAERRKTGIASKAKPQGEERPGKRGERERAGGTRHGGEQTQTREGKELHRQGPT